MWYVPRALARIAVIALLSKQRRIGGRLEAGRPKAALGLRTLIDGSFINPVDSALRSGFDQTDAPPSLRAKRQINPEDHRAAVDDVGQERTLARYEKRKP
jgi:hypothetical protein